MPAAGPGPRVAVQFGAAMHTADVYLNGQRLQRHVGGYLPFTVDITPRVKYGQDNVLLVVRPQEKKKKLIGAIDMKDPRGLLFDGQGRLLVATGTQVKRLSIDLAKATLITEEVLVVKGLEDAQQMANIGVLPVNGALVVSGVQIAAISRWTMTVAFSGVVRRVFTEMSPAVTWAEQEAALAHHPW